MNLNDDRLAELLRETDRAVPLPPAGPADLAVRVRRRAAQRRVVRLTSGAVAAAVALTFGSMVLFRAVLHETVHHETGTPLVSVGRPSDHRTEEEPRPPFSDREELTRLRAELEQLRADADATLAMVKALNARQQQQMRAAALAEASADPREQIRRELERAAFTLAYQADRKYRELGLRQSAITDYRQIIELFPETPSAQVARERLSQIEANQGDQL